MGIVNNVFYGFFLLILLVDVFFVVFELVDIFLGVFICCKELIKINVFWWCFKFEVKNVGDRFI